MKVGGFIGGHLVEKLKSVGYWVRGVDTKRVKNNTKPILNNYL